MTTSDDYNVVDKTTTLVKTVQGELKEESGILNPVITFELDEVPNFNYAQIPAFGNRYYFVDGEPVSISYNLWRITFKHDPLMNLKSQFRELSGVILRQENDFNNYLVDGDAPVESKVQISVKRIGNASFNTKNRVLIYSAAATKEV